MPARRSRLRAHCSLIVAVSASLAAGAAFAADGDPVRLLLTETLTHDDNVFRATVPISDSYTSVLAGVTVDAHQSRQQFHLELSEVDTRYAQLNNLDNNISDGLVSWQATFPYRFAAGASWSRSQSLANYTYVRNQAKDIVTTNTANLNLSYNLHPDWSITVLIIPVTSTNSAAIDNVNDSQITTKQIKLEYDSPHGNQIGLLADRITGHYLHLQFVGVGLVNNDFSQDDLQAYLKWSPSAKTALSATAGNTRRNQVDLPQRNFTGTTGQIGLTWTPTAVTSFAVAASRNVSAQSLQLANYSIARSTTFTAGWTPPGKFSAQAQLGRSSLVYAGSPGFLLGQNVPEEVDHTHNAGFTLTYDAPRYLHLSLQMNHEVRTSNVPNIPYIDNMATFSANIKY